MDPDVTISRLAKKLFTLLWLKQGLIATLPPSGPTSPRRINDISEKIAKSVLVYSYANRPILQFYMEKHSQRIAQSKIAFWTHVSFLCLRIRLCKDDLFDYFLNTCSIMSEVALFCNSKTLDHVHGYASTFFAAFFESELSGFFYEAGGWAGLLNYIEDSCFKELYDMVEPFASEMKTPCDLVPILVYVAAEEFSAERRERIASSRERKVEEIERFEPVRLLTAKIFNWDFMEHLHISTLKPGVFRRVANIRRKSRGNTISIGFPGSSRKLFKGDDQQLQEPDGNNSVSYMNSTPNLRTAEYETPQRNGKSFLRSISVDQPTTPLQASTRDTPGDSEIFQPSVFRDDKPTCSFLVTSSWLKPQETKYERPSYKTGVLKGNLNTYFQSSESGDLPVGHVSRTDLSIGKKFTSSKTSLDYDGCAKEYPPNVQNVNPKDEDSDIIQSKNANQSANGTSSSEDCIWDSKTELKDMMKPKSEFVRNAEIGKEMSDEKLENLNFATKPKGLFCANDKSYDETDTKCDSALQDPENNFSTPSRMTEEFLSNTRSLSQKINPNTSFAKQSETIYSNQSLKKQCDEFTEEVTDIIELGAEGVNSSVTRALDLDYDTPETPRDHYQSFEFAEGIESVAIKPNRTVHYKKHRFGNLFKREYRVTPATGDSFLESLNKSKRSSPRVTGARRKILSNSETTESETESRSRKNYNGGNEKIPELVKALKKSGISDPVVFKI